MYLDLMTSEGTTEEPSLTPDTQQAPAGSRDPVETEPSRWFKQFVELIWSQSRFRAHQNLDYIFNSFKEHSVKYLKLM